MANDFTLTVRPEGSWVVVAPCGEIDLATAPQLEDALQEHETAHVLIDLSKVDFMDSSGLRVLIGRQSAQAADGSVALLSPSDAVTRLLEVAGLEGVFTIHSSIPSYDPG